MVPTAPSASNLRLIAQATADLEAWLETMRGADGYSGPVVHWWQNCLSFAGPGLDWRYEGIIYGYLTLFKRTRNRRWLVKARRAGDDLIRGQLPGGNYANSSFELNPYAGGTPHEAAVDVALLRLAQVLRDNNASSWEGYAWAAENNLQEYYISRLWDPTAQSFRDAPDGYTLVPNKVCTLCEALFAWAELRGNDAPIECYVVPTLNNVLSLQRAGPGRLAGAIAQNQIGRQVVSAFFPYYIARCIRALLLVHAYDGAQRWLDAAAAAMSFVARQVDEHGRLPQVLYPRGMNQYPQWIAPLGDVLRVAGLMAQFGVSFPSRLVEATLIDGQLASGGVATAHGYAAQIRQKTPGPLPDFRDLLPVAGWCDKAFRYFATRVPIRRQLPPAVTETVNLTCQIRGRPATWMESAEEMQLSRNRRMLYRWQKGSRWAAIVAPETSWK
jgi:hypothetical protein